jgi:glycosyl transferase family 25
MQLFVINLARRIDRLAAMTAQLDRLGLRAARIAALDAGTTREGFLAQYFTPSGPLGILPKGDKCCSLSHRRAWEAFVETGQRYAAVLEDDVVFDAAAAALLGDAGWIPEGTDLIKLEHFGPDSQRVLVGSPIPVASGRTIAPILSRHTGGAAYVVSRAAAIKLLAVTRWNVPVDHLLFNPNVSPLARQLKPYQMLPAIARQAPDAASDIRPWRLADRRLSLKLAKREIVRAYYECRLLPQQIAAVLAGHAHLARVAGQLSSAGLLNRV